MRCGGPRLPNNAAASGAYDPVRSNAALSPLPTLPRVAIRSEVHEDELCLGYRKTSCALGNRLWRLSEARRASSKRYHCPATRKFLDLDQISMRCVQTLRRAPIHVIFESLFARIDARAFNAIRLDVSRSSCPYVLCKIAPFHAGQKLLR
jgi:hypothetical protein